MTYILYYIRFEIIPLLRYNKGWRRKRFSSSRKNIMIDTISSASQANFLPGNLPANTENFYNSTQFGQGQVQYISTIMSMGDQAIQRGLDQIKDAINDVT
jgi:hypothetical protein